MSVTLINPFEVPSGKEEQFLREWTAAAELMRHEPGFLSSRLHQSLNPTLHTLLSTRSSLNKRLREGVKRCVGNLARTPLL